MQQKNKSLTQKQRFAEELEAICADVTEKDRKTFMEKNGKGPTVVSNYLNGKVANVDLAAKMLIFFRAQIEERNKIICPNPKS